MLRISFQLAALASSTFSYLRMPALLTRMSRRPNFCAVPLTKSRHEGIRASPGGGGAETKLRNNPMHLGRFGIANGSNARSSTSPRGRPREKPDAGKPHGLPFQRQGLRFT